MKNSILLPIIFSIFFFSCQKKITTTPLQFALLCEDVYEEESTNPPQPFESYLTFDKEDYNHKYNIDVGKVYNLAKKKDWKNLVPYLGMKAFSKGGYFGRAYINNKSNEIIIAHRGTDLDIKLEKLSLDQIATIFEDGKLWNFLMDVDDDFDIFEGKIPQQQFQAAQFFTQKVKMQYMNDFKKEPKITHTGHSLGAILAELSAVKDGAKAITFESPGSQPLIAQLPEDELVRKDAAEIITYNAEPNQINSLHQQMGNVISLYQNEEGENLDSRLQKIQSLKFHSIKELIKRFDEKTGEPKF